MTLRLVSPDRKLFLMADEDDLKAVAELYKLTSKQKGNIRQLLGWVSVGNRSGDRNDRAERKESENFMLFHNIYWLKHDDGTEYVPLVGKPQHMFDSMVTPRADMKFGSKESMSKLLNGSRAHIGPWKKVSPPRQVFSLGNGSSLVGLQACAALTLTLRATQPRSYRAYVHGLGVHGLGASPRPQTLLVACLMYAWLTFSICIHLRVKDYGR